jgi:hypothetical protein
MARRKRRRGPVVLKRGLGKDGGLSPYTIAHPTNYVWRDPDVEAFTRHLVNIPRFKGKIWINTYYKHPPVYEGETDIVSFDVWGAGGRGDPLPVDIGQEVWNYIFNYVDPPDIWWGIYRGRMWVRDPITFRTWWEGSPPGPPDSDPRHDWHIHITVLQWLAQMRLRGWA